MEYNNATKLMIKGLNDKHHKPTWSRFRAPTAASAGAAASTAGGLNDGGIARHCCRQLPCYHTFYMLHDVQDFGLNQRRTPRLEREMQVRWNAQKLLLLQQTANLHVRFCSPVPQQKPTRLLTLLDVFRCKQARNVQWRRLDVEQPHSMKDIC